MIYFAFFGVCFGWWLADRFAERIDRIDCENIARRDIGAPEIKLTWYGSTKRKWK